MIKCCSVRGPHFVVLVFSKPDKFESQQLIEETGKKCSKLARQLCKQILKSSILLVGTFSASVTSIIVWSKIWSKLQLSQSAPIKSLILLFLFSSALCSI